MYYAIALALLIGLAFITATVARDKGYDFATFYVLGFFFFLITLIVALCLKDKGEKERLYYMETMSVNSLDISEARENPSSEAAYEKIKARYHNNYTK